MLAVLKIKNLALVDDLTWELGPGLVGVTGQTGAGKSMIIGALKLILGERANHDLIRTGESSCAVEAIFELGNNLPQVNELLEEAGLEPCDGNTLVVKRIFGGGSGNKQFVNCSPCTLAILKSLGTLLVDLHGPHEHQSLLSQDRQLAMLDAYAQAGKERLAYATAWRTWQRANDELEEFRGLRQATDSEIELLRYQVEEIETAELDPEQEEELEQRYRLVTNGARLVEHAGDAARDLGGAVDQLGEAQRAFRELEKLDPAIAKFSGGFESARVELEEIDSALKDYLADLEFDPSEVAEMERRIDLIENLKRKYGHSLADVVAYGVQARERLHRIDQREEAMEQLDAAVAEARVALDKVGAVLSKKRKNAAPKLAKEIGGHLLDLGFKQSYFDVPLTATEVPHSRGFETVDFMFAPNPGEPPKPLRVVASSGEMSRVMLAVKSALADQDQIPLMVFDEIDANVGGEIAHAVGRKMSALGDRHQVIAITHMPQVAALAHHHYLVCKEFSQDSTRSTLRAVEKKDRVSELARMLGGVGNEALALAQSMLSGKKA
ncbi:MAG: DNA repair protein RecN [Verrucomicrobiae bacterium]|nr:DNA repair protein RecN [Verrucomicrobiae bacterium]